MQVKGKEEKGLEGKLHNLASLSGQVRRSAVMFLLTCDIEHPGATDDDTRVGGEDTGWAQWAAGN